MIKMHYENLINSAQTLARKQKQSFELDVFLNVIEPYVRKNLQKFYSDNTSDYIVFSFANLAKKAVKKLARLYTKKPKRKFKNMTDLQAEFLNSLYQKMGVDTVMQKANEIYKLSNQAHIAVLPTVNEYGDQMLGVQFIPNHHIDVIPSVINPQVAESYIVGSNEVRAFMLDIDGETRVYSGVEDSYMATMWTKDKVIVGDFKNGYIYNQELQDQENPLGLMPICEIAGEKYGSYWKVATESSAEFTVQLNASLSDAGQAKRYQGMPIGWMKGTSEQLKADIRFGPNKFYKLPSDVNGTSAEVGFTNPNVDLDKLVNFDSALISLFLTCMDLDPTSINAKANTQKFTSGFDRLLAMIEAFQPSLEDQDLFQRKEQRLLKIIIAYLETYGGSDVLGLPNLGTFSDDASVVVEYQRPEQELSKLEQLDVLQREVEQGLKSRIEAIAEYRNITIEEAQDYAQNQGIDFI